ncbi:ADP-ribosylglycohydrolase family protein [Myroides sp. 1354]|uniref:ADP-ribosylglycohydrolase family protein n=1 Tax=unclassified Myroides TaxID=2642485 RepID=UPI0025772245|nr:MULTISPECIES: ADP-ribosylglycohydrolase family protein [unclassified Myroides]MDM1046055.1 ADP-ribosylglycohydrolase family protein [Myroides sp. R163-1]MDM1056991.1 ADP-ribosylglycohydrolase family protein [Myroides sp. 1354]MDM1070186.1 ADP-ribosylglycohydrolase family protein [Myroides sp. 1372]
MSNLAKDILFGISVADALGVPVEFKSPADINLASVQSNYQDISNRFLPFGSWNKPVGTFSDDSSLTFCTAEYLAAGETDLNDLMDRFKQWLKEGYWTTDGHTFDVGRTTLFAIENFIADYNWRTTGLNTERDNGNGSLMRIAPLLLPLLYDQTITDPYQYICDFSSVTHAHSISVDSCFIYLMYAKQLYYAKDTALAFVKMKEELGINYVKNPVFKRLFSEDFLSLSPTLFNSQGYVVGSLEIAMHSLLTTNSYEEAILQAISLGKDTDTNAAITGALAGLLYGYDSIPSHWIDPLKRKEDIEALANQLYATCTRV